MLGGRKTAICESLGTGMISVMPVLATLALCFLHSTNFAARILCEKLVEPVFDTSNVAVGAVGIDTVKVVVDGNVANIILWESVVDVQACQRGITSKS